VRAAEAAWSDQGRGSGGSFTWSADGGTALSETEKQKRRAVFPAEGPDIVPDPDLPEPATSFTRRWNADDAATEVSKTPRWSRSWVNFSLF
jgi:hypothetical protein